MDGLPPDVTFAEAARRFRTRFSNNEAARNQFFTDFWHRRQQPSEPASTYIEEMAHLARRMQLDNEPLTRLTIIDGLLPEIRRDVTVQQPRSLDELAAVAAIGEANARVRAVHARNGDAAVADQLTELRLMMSQFHTMVTSV